MGDIAIKSLEKANVKKLIVGTLTLILTVAPGFADTFTDAIQDLAVTIACKGTYSMTEAGGGWYDDPHDYYTPQMMAERFAKESGNKTMTVTFYGVCFNYAQYGFSDIQKYKSWYNTKGMYEGQFWIAAVGDNPNQIELMSIGTKNDYTRLVNGEYIKTYSTSLRNAKAHNGATRHAWLWIQRSDGVWFWVDPTWTDNAGYVVYGYVSSDGKEIQCRPEKEYCVTYPAYLNNLPAPPAMGAKIAPSKTANSTNRNETINDAGREWWFDTVMRKTFIDVDYGFMKEWIALLASAGVPASSITDKSISADKMSFALEMPILFDGIALLIGLEYLHNLDDENRLHGVLFEVDFTRRLFSNIAWYIGGGAGLRFDFSNDYCAPKIDFGPTMADGTKLIRTGWGAWKIDTGLIINISHLFTKIEVSYDNVIGFSVGAGTGFGLEL